MSYDMGTDDGIGLLASAMQCWAPYAVEILLHCPECRCVAQQIGAACAGDAIFLNNIFSAISLCA